MQFQEFSTGNKARDLILLQMRPIIQKLEGSWKKIRNQMDEFRLKFEFVQRFQSEKMLLQKNVKEVKSQSYENRNSLCTLKSEVEIGQSKNVAFHSTLKEQVLSLQRTLTRRDETLINYDRKINQINETVTKSQVFVNDRMGVFQQKYKKLAKQTLQMTKNVKKDFDNSVSSNQILRSQLVHKMMKIQQKQKILDLYLAQRQETVKKFTQLYQMVNGCLKINQFQQYKKMQIEFLEDNFSKVKQEQQRYVLPQQTLKGLKLINIKFAEIDEVKLKLSKIEQIKKQIFDLGESLKKVEQTDNKRIDQIKVENQEMEQKIIEVMDKKLQTIQENIEELNNKTQMNIQDRLALFKEQFCTFFNEKIKEQQKLIEKIKPVSVVTDSSSLQTKLTAELLRIQQQREKMDSYSSSVKQIAEGLNDRLSLFSNRITVCKSDIEIFTDNTKKQLKRINQLKQQQQINMQRIGKILSQFMESIFILTSLAIQQEKVNVNNSFVTYQDGIIYQIDKDIQANEIIYRRNIIKTKELKQSLLYSLMNMTDQICLNYPSLKWNIYKPSQFFKNVKQNMQTRQRANRSNSLLIHSNRKTVRKQTDEQITILDFRKGSEELFKDGQNHQNSAALTIGNIPWPSDRPKTGMQKRYKIRLSEQRNRKQAEQRCCITASKSQRKAKLSYF